MPLRLLSPLQAALAPLEHKALLPAEWRLAAPNRPARTYALAHRLARPVLHDGFWLIKLTRAGRDHLERPPPTPTPAIIPASTPSYTVVNDLKRSEVLENKGVTTKSEKNTFWATFEKIFWGRLGVGVF